MQVERITAVELEEFVSGCVERPGADLPMSTRRAGSLVRHPLVDPKDVLLYVIRDGKEVIAYQNLVPDRIAGIRFMWLSAVWVRADWRGQRLASAIFRSILRDTEGLLAGTNQAPVRQKRMRKDDRFVEMENDSVVRWYRRFALSHFLAHRLPAPKVMRPVLKGLDGFLNALHDPMWSIGAVADGPQPESQLGCTAEDAHFLSQFGPFTSIDAQLLSWRLQYPWLGNEAADQSEQERYAFSVYAEEFQNYSWRFRNERDEIQALLWIQLREGHVKVPFWKGTELGSRESAIFLRRWLQKKKVKSVNMSAFEAEILTSRGYSGWLRRQLDMPVFVHRTLADQIPTEAWTAGYGLHRGDWGMT